MNDLSVYNRPVEDSPPSEFEMRQLKTNIKSQMLQLDSLSQLMNQVDETESFGLDIEFFHGLSKFLKSMSKISAETLSWLDTFEMSGA